MRIVAAGSTPDAAGRMDLATLGLALRGHEVIWTGEPPPTRWPTTLRRASRARDLWKVRADAVVGDAGRLWRAALLGWQAQANCMVLALGHERVAGWSQVDRWAWHSLDAHGLLEPNEADAFRADPLGLDPQRLALWPDVPPGRVPDAAHPDTEILERACERALAHHRGQALRSAVFVDRDGTLVREVGYLSDPEDLELLPGAPEGLRQLQAAGYAVIVVSNQSGVDRGLYSLSRVHEAMARLRVLLRAHGVELDGIYFCPHRPEVGCPCRKPEPGLLELAADNAHIALGLSVMIGDKLLDAACGQRVGAKGILVRSGHGHDQEHRIGVASAPGSPGVVPDAVCEDLAGAAAWVLSRTGGAA